MDGNLSSQVEQKGTPNDLLEDIIKVTKGMCSIKCSEHVMEVHGVFSPRESRYFLHNF